MIVILVLNPSLLFVTASPRYYNSICNQYNYIEIIIIIFEIRFQFYL